MSAIVALDMKTDEIWNASETINVYFQTVTPEYANKILMTRNPANRKIDRNRVARYANDMLEGAWHNNGDPIRFESNGKLADGQHRLSAIVKASMAQEMLIIENLTHEAKMTIDTGKARSGGDVLSMEYGVAKAEGAAISQAFQRYTAYRKKKRTEMRVDERPSNKQIAEMYMDRHDQMEEIIAWYKETYRSGSLALSKSEVYFLMLVFTEYDKSEAKSFMEQLLSGSEITLDSAAWQAREILMRAKVGSTKIKAKARLFSVMRCFLKHAEGAAYSNYHNAIWREGKAVPSIEITD